jgi:hypothetical protein
MSKPKGPLLVVLAVVAVAAALVTRELLLERVTVIAADGTPVVIELDPELVMQRRRERQGEAHDPAATMPAPPEGSGREVNLAGTEGR